MRALDEKGRALSTFHVTTRNLYNNPKSRRFGIVLILWMQKVTLREASCMSQSHSWEEKEQGFKPRQPGPKPRFLGS